MTAYLGIDLAWGTRSPTGLAVLDAAGRLVHVSAVRTDDEIVAALAPYAEGRVVAGIDAPLVVTNPTGSRPAEQALSADFRKFHAGTHPSNTGKPEFADGTHELLPARSRPEALANVATVRTVDRPTITSRGSV